LFDDLVGRQQPVNVVDQTFEAAGVAFYAHLLPQRVGAAGSSVLDHAQRLASKRVEPFQPLGEQDRTQVGDVPATCITGTDQTIVRQRCQDPVAVCRQGAFEEIEIGRIIQEPENLVGKRMFRSDTVLELGLVEDAPQGALLLREILQFLRKIKDEGG
jgi:hypothetical protein